MNRFAIVVCFSLIAAPALAEAYPPHCEPITKIKEAAKEAKFTTMTAGQVHFLEGLYVASPITPPGGLPPGNGALLMEVKGKFTGVIWTRGKEGCITPIVADQQSHQAIYMPMPLTPELLAMLEKIKTGRDEVIAPSDDTSGDVHL